jgi:hypothetical protein
MAGGVGMTTRIIVLAVLVLLTACGKKSAPTAPGPAGQITYPRNYPSVAIQQD